MWPIGNEPRRLAIPPALGPSSRERRRRRPRRQAHDDRRSAFAASGRGLLGLPVPKPERPPEVPPHPDHLPPQRRWVSQVARPCDERRRPGRRVDHRVRSRPVLLVARGTSDYGALYGKYLAEIVHRVPCGLVSPSTMPAYGAQPDLSGVLMVGVSESGGSPDLVQSLKLLCKRHWLRRRQSRAPEDDPATDGHTCY